MVLDRNGSYSETVFVVSNAIRLFAFSKGEGDLRFVEPEVEYVMSITFVDVQEL